MFRFQTSGAGQVQIGGQMIYEQQVQSKGSPEEIEIDTSQWPRVRILHWLRSLLLVKQVVN